MYDVTLRRADGTTKTHRVRANTRSTAEGRAIERDLRTPGGGGPYTVISCSYVAHTERTR